MKLLSIDYSNLNGSAVVVNADSSEQLLNLVLTLFVVISLGFAIYMSYFFFKWLFARIFGYTPDGTTHDEPLSVFIVGPEGAGKTVFLAALSRFADTNPDKILFEPKDFGSSQYVTNSLQLLDCGKWPKSNPLGDLQTFKWKIGKPDGPHHEISLFDYSGQDMRSILLEDNAEKLQGRPRDLLMEIDHADLLIYLLDADGLIGGGSLLEINENSWLLRAFLTRSNWVKTRRILVLTKADLYTEMIDEAGGDVRTVIGRQLEGSPGGAALSRQLGTVQCLSLTSVKTRTRLVDDSSPVREPKFPIESEGFEPLTKAILSALKDAKKGKTQF